MSSLSDSDVETLQSIGHDTITTIVALTVETFLYAIYVVLVTVAGRILLKKGRSKRSIVTFTALLVMLLLDAGAWLIDIHDAIAKISLTLTSMSDLSLADRYALTDNLPFPVESAIYAFMCNIGDAIIIWRVFAFWSGPRERWFLAFPLSLLLASIILSALISNCVTQLGDNFALGNFVSPSFCKNIQTVSYSTSFATTAVATIMISYKTWQYRRTIGSNLSMNSARTRTEKIMIILIESGFLYLLFFLEAVVSSTGNITEEEDSTQGLAFADTIWEYMTSHIVGIYPTVVVILVSSQRSYIDTVTKSTLGSSSGYTQDSSGRTTTSVPYWGGSRGANSRRNIGHVVDMHVHELHSVRATESVDYDNLETKNAASIKQDSTIV